MNLHYIKNNIKFKYIQREKKKKKKERMHVTFL